MQRIISVSSRAFLPIVLLLSLILPTSFLCAQSPTDPRIILSRSDSAHRALRSAASHGRWLYRGSSDQDTIAVAGRTLFVRDSFDVGIGARVRIELTDGRLYTYKDHHLQLLIPERKTMLEIDAAEAPEKPITGDFCSYLLPPLKHDQITTDALTKALRLELVGTDSMGGAACYRINAFLPDNDYFTSPVTTFYIGMEDYLLRGSRAEYQFAGGLQWEDRMITYDEIDVRPAPELFTQRTPEGFTVKHPKRPKDSDIPKLLAVGEEAPDWSLAGGDGDSIRLAGLRGKLVLLDFWYSTCGPCIAAMPGIQRLHERFADRGVIVIGMNALERGDPVATMKRMGLTYRLALRADPVAARYHVTGYPTFYIIGVDGEIIYRDVGYGTEMESVLEKAIEGYLKERGM